MPLTPPTIALVDREPRVCADCGLRIARTDLQRQPQALYCRRCESERERCRARPRAAEP